MAVSCPPGSASGLESNQTLESNTTRAVMYTLQPTTDTIVNNTYYQESSLLCICVPGACLLLHTSLHNSRAVPPSHIILHTFSLEFVFLSPKKWYLNLFLSGCTSNSSGPRRGSFSCAAASLTGKPLSSSSIRRLKTSVNLFMLLFHASRALEETADVVKGHWNSFKIISKSLHTIKL